MTSELRRTTTRTSNSRDHWRTPSHVQELFTSFCKEEGMSTWDPFPSPKPEFQFCEFNHRMPGLLSVPRKSTAAWCNPPYGRALLRHARTIDALMANLPLAISLTPARPGTRWWSELARPGRIVIVPNDRFHFDDAEDPAMFASAMIVGGTNRTAAFAWSDAWRGEAWIAAAQPSVALVRS